MRTLKGKVCLFLIAFSLLLFLLPSQVFAQRMFDYDVFAESLFVEFVSPGSVEVTVQWNEVEVEGTTFDFQDSTEIRFDVEIRVNGVPLAKSRIRRNRRLDCLGALLVHGVITCGGTANCAGKNCGLTRFEKLVGGVPVVCVVTANRCVLFAAMGGLPALCGCQPVTPLAVRKWKKRFSIDSGDSIEFVVDPQNEVAELDESNNTLVFGPVQILSSSWGRVKVIYR